MPDGHATPDRVQCSWCGYALPEHEADCPQQPARAIPNRVIQWHTCSCGDTHLHPSDAHATPNSAADTQRIVDWLYAEADASPRDFADGIRRALDLLGHHRESAT